MAYTSSRLDMLNNCLGMVSPKNNQTLLVNKSPKAWIPMDGTFESQVKLHQRMMKPLQVNQKLQRAASALHEFGRFSQEAATTEKPEDYNKLMKQVKDINAISRHQDELIGKLRKASDIEKENILQKHLSERTYRYIKMARESSLPRESVKSVARLEDVKEESVHEEKNKKLAKQLSFVENKRVVGKQLNSNAHFRHAKRKILILRAFDSAVNHKEKVKEIYDSLNRCRSEKTLENNTGGSNSFTGNSNTLGITTLKSINMDDEEEKVKVDFVKESSVVDLDGYFGSSTVSIGDHKTTAPSLRHLKTSTTIELPSFAQGDRTTKSQMYKSRLEKSPDSLTSLNTIPQGDEELSLGLKRSSSKKVLFLDDKRLISPKAAGESKTSPKNIKSLFMTIVEDDSVSNRNSIGSLSNLNENKFFIKSEYWTPQNNGKALKNELLQNLKEEQIQKSTRVPVQNFKSMKPIKLPETLKHFRSSTFASKSFQRQNSTKNIQEKKRVVVTRGRKEKSMNQNDYGNMATSTVQQLIEKSYQTDSKERQLSEEDMQMLFNSYGFEDTIGNLKKPKSPRSKFVVLEGYQKEFLKASLAKTERFVNKSMVKTPKS